MWGFDLADHSTTLATAPAAAASIAAHVALATPAHAASTAAPVAFEASPCQASAGVDHGVPPACLKHGTT